MTKPDGYSYRYEGTDENSTPDDTGRAKQKTRSTRREKLDDNTIVPTPLEVFSVNELLTREYNPLKWIIPDILPEGLTLFSAAPKIGKSMVALAIALRMARRVTGGVDGDVLYLSLDDVSERRLQSRVRSLLQGKEVEAHVFFATESCSLDTGLIEQLEMWMNNHQETTLIVIDVYGAVKPKRVGDDVYKNDYSALNSLRTFATKHRVAIILVHHTRKKKDDGDWINNINGSNGLAGACDTLWYLKRERGEQSMQLLIDGREDGLANSVALTLEDLDLPWTIDGDATPDSLNSSEKVIIQILQEQAIPLAPKSIAELSTIKNTRYLIRRMLAKGLVSQTTYGKYELPLGSSRVTEDAQETASTEYQTECFDPAVNNPLYLRRTCFKHTIDEHKQVGDRLVCKICNPAMAI